MYPKPAFLHCPSHGGSSYSPGDQCVFCKTGYEPSELDANLMPKPSALRRLARKTDPSTSHDGVKQIRAKHSQNRAKILALDFGDGLNYRQIAEQADIYPTTASRTITTMVREGSLVVARTDGRTQYYVPANGLPDDSDMIEDEEL